jgi:hypothetical protein
MRRRTADEHKRRGVLWIIAGVIFLAAMLGMWWLVEETNEEGTHDAELLPFFALVPLVIGVYHMMRSRLERTRTGRSRASR